MTNVGKSLKNLKCQLEELKVAKPEMPVTFSVDSYGRIRFANNTFVIARELLIQGGETLLLQITVQAGKNGKSYIQLPNAIRQALLPMVNGTARRQADGTYMLKLPADKEKVKPLLTWPVIKIEKAE